MIPEEMVRVQLDEGAFLPERGFVTDAGADLRTPKRFILRAGESITIDTGVHIETPPGWFWEVRSKSGLMVNDRIITDGTVDAEYSGSIRVCLFNLGRSHKVFEAGDKIAQIVIQRVKTPQFVQVEKIREGRRGDRGFGSTGR